MRRPDSFAATALAVTLTLIAVSGLSLRFRKSPSPARSHLACAVDIRSYADTSRSLATGYNYHLLIIMPDAKALH